MPLEREQAPQITTRIEREGQDAVAERLHLLAVDRT